MEEDIVLEMFSKGQTNRLVVGWSGNENDKVLVRVYGQGTELFIDRKREIQHFILLEKNGCGGKIYASFNNGIVYEFIQGHTFKQAELYVEKRYHEVAKTMAR